MRSYELEVEGFTLSVPIDYSGDEKGHVNIWVDGIEAKRGDSGVAASESVVKTAVETLTEYLLSTSTRVCVRWSADRKQLHVPKEVPLKVRIGDRIARWYRPKGRK